MNITVLLGLMAGSKEDAERVEAFLAATSADVRHGGDPACYIPALDRIQLPP